MTIVAFAGNAFAGADIIDGDMVRPIDNLHRHIVRIIVTKSDNSTGICTGSIISRDIILTAAHCFPAGSKSAKVEFPLAHTSAGFAYHTKALNYRVLTDVSALPKSAPSPKNNSKRQKVKHSNYLHFNQQEVKSRNAKEATRTTWNNIYQEYNDGKKLLKDIALVKVGGIPRGYYPIRLYKGSVSFKQTLSAAGFGTSTRFKNRNKFDLKKADFSLIGMAAIKDRGIQGWQLHSPSSQNVCFGDSGGPLMLKIGGEYQQVGVNVFGNKSCTNGSFATNVLFYKDWIEAAAASLGSKIAL